MYAYWSKIPNPRRGVGELRDAMEPTITSCFGDIFASNILSNKTRWCLAETLLKKNCCFALLLRSQFEHISDHKNDAIFNTQNHYVVVLRTFISVHKSFDCNMQMRFSSTGNNRTADGIEVGENTCASVVGLSRI